jgi:DNA modification methylase
VAAEKDRIRDRTTDKINSTPGRSKTCGLTRTDYATRNKRDVWTVNTKPFKGAHFATFPAELIEPCILAGCPKGGTALDPFMGSGTVAEVAVKNDRNYIGIDINPAYCRMADERVRKFTKQIEMEDIEECGK